MSVYHEFTIKVESEHRGPHPHDQAVLTIASGGNGGLAIEYCSREIRNREEWREFKAAIETAGAQLGWYD